MTKRSGIVSTHIVIALLMAVVCLGQEVQPANLPGPGTNPAQNIAQSPTASNQPELQQRNPRYTVRPDDVLNLSFEFSPEFNQSLSVQPDGYISLRGLGDLYVTGKTVPQLNEELRLAYGKILYQPIVVVTLQEFEKPYFIAGGQVSHPGKYDLRGDTTVTQAVAIAGGYSQIAKHSQVLLFRHVSDGWMETQVLNMKKMLAEKNLHEDLHLRPGDMVFVPQNRISKIERFLPTPRAMVYMNPTQF